MDMISGYISRDELLRNRTYATHKPPKGMPLFIPRSQAYFWTPEWQAGEREAQREIDAGLARRFENVEDALRWLRDER